MVDFSVYNPSINAFAAVQVATLFQRDGAVKTSVSILSFPLFTNRFQPSIAFEVVLAGVIVILVRPCEPRPPTRRGAYQFGNPPYPFHDDPVPLAISRPDGGGHAAAV